MPVEVVALEERVAVLVEQVGVGLVAHQLLEQEILALELLVPLTQVVGVEVLLIMLVLVPLLAAQAAQES